MTSAGGLGSVWDYGPLGVELKKNVKDRWWRAMVHARDDIEGLDAAILDEEALFLEVTFNGEVLTPRVAVNAAPFALRAKEAELAEVMYTLYILYKHCIVDILVIYTYEARGGARRAAPGHPIAFESPRRATEHGGSGGL